MPTLKARSPLRDAMAACRSHLIGIAIFSALLNILYLSPTLYMLQMYGRVLPARSESTLLLLTAVFVFAVGTLSMLDWVRARLLVRASVRLDHLISPRILSAIIGRRSTANSQALRDFDALRNTLTGPGLLALFDAPWTPIYVLVCFVIHPLLGCFALLSCALLLLITYFNERSVKGPLREAHATGARVYSLIDHSATAGALVRALGLRRALIERHLQQRRQSTEAAAGASFAAGGFLTLTKFVRLAAQSMALGLGVFLAVEQHISAGEIFAASLLVTRSLAPIEQLVGAWKSLAQAMTSWKDVSELILGAAAEETERTLLPAPTGRLAVESLSVLSPARDRVIIGNVSFGLRPGEVLGIVGPSGAGKSTLVRALAGAGGATQGAIRYDGFNLQDWNEDQLATHIGFCPQEPTLLAGTIKENIARFHIGDAERGAELDAAVVAAAKAGGSHEMIARLPAAYETQLGLGGAGLSAGQAQRGSLARAMFGGPQVVLLDEPNAHLDAQGEQDLLDALMRLKQQGVTVVIVAHRSSVISAIDNLLVLKGGAVEMFGPRDDVLRQMAGANAPATAEGLRPSRRRPTPSAATNAPATMGA